MEGERCIARTWLRDHEGQLRSMIVRSKGVWMNGIGSFGRARAVEENAGGCRASTCPTGEAPVLIWKTVFIRKLVMVMGPNR